MKRPGAVSVRSRGRCGSPPAGANAGGDVPILRSRLRAKGARRRARRRQRRREDEAVARRRATHAREGRERRRAGQIDVVVVGPCEASSGSCPAAARRRAAPACRCGASHRAHASRDRRECDCSGTAFEPGDSTVVKCRQEPPCTSARKSLRRLVAMRPIAHDRDLAPVGEHETADVERIAEGMFRERRARSARSCRGRRRSPWS